MHLFKGFKNMISSIAQIALVVIFLPIVAMVIGMISKPQDGVGNLAGFMGSLIDNIPLCEVWADILNQYHGGITTETVLSSTVLVILKAFPEALISALCVYACVQLFTKWNARGLPIFAGFIGIVIATLITTVTGLSDNVATEILADFGVLIVMVIGLRIMMKSVFVRMKVFSPKKILLFVIDALFAVVTTAYVTGLLLAAAGTFETVWQAVRRIILLSAIEILAALLVGFISVEADKDKTVF